MKDYSVLKEEEYEAVSRGLNILANAFMNRQQAPEPYDPKELNQISQEVLQFLKHLL
ncbi:hypothetical protein [Adhaeribacter pallidiroseus]|uniref:Uncharacterized protein n=1 Tax=Adhaeribacter pallidiroseus TaxID=2072847 RepID=A0A369QIK0_9BACT|nr:hypothetical protein [Adhaeribacter pallidiroseus]RDC62118.1 hypothetical protein AHMF7616_00709 [Adhaeribacter pallidiroseus]